MRNILLLIIGLSCLSVYPESTESIRAGQDYALFFAVNQYDKMDKLDNPIKNARDIAQELEKSYGFKTEVVANPTIDQIDQKIDEYKELFSNGTYPASGQLFIYFSGHGIQTANNGYFMTKASDPDRPQRSAMEYDYYRAQIDEINCQHILVVIDACHSATFDPSYGARNDGRRFERKGEGEFDRILANHESYQARCFWTSDGKGEQTPDQSSFAYHLLEGLRTPYSAVPYLRSSELFASYLEKASPQPGGGHFGSDEASSCFLFFKKQLAIPINVLTDRAAYEQAQTDNTARAYRQYINNFPKGDFVGLAQQKLNILETKEREFSDWIQAKAQNTHKAYDDFIAAHPNSIYREVAELNKKNILTTPNPPTKSNNMVFVKGGTFQMGSNDGYSDEKPVHNVSVSDFYIAKYEVTQKEWRTVMGSDPATLYNKGCDECPVEGVSWNDIQSFLTKLNQQKGEKYRLPTEAEWEYAARGGQQSKGYRYAGSNQLKDVAWYNENAKNGNTFGDEKTTRPVGTKQANELGLYDMSGNVWEWCEDDWHGDYNNAPNNGSAWRDSPRGSGRVDRGGSWNSRAEYCRVANRSGWNPEGRCFIIGFRLAYSL